MENDCSLSSADWFIFNVYGSEFCKESLEYLSELTLPEFLIIEEYVAVREAVKAAHYKDEEAKHRK